MVRKKLSIFILVLLSIFTLAASVFAVSEQEMEFLRMYFTDEELEVVSTTRSLKSISRVAENVEVVSKAEIELMGAHTIGEVLNRINGVQVQPSGANTFSLSAIMIQGSFSPRVTVMIDGIIVNDVAGNRPDHIAQMPVNFIERIEVIKGPASSVWGSALGGIINIITKSAGSSEKPSGTLQASYGERETSDLSAELFGKKDRFGYYLSARLLDTDGFNPKSDRLNRNFFTKLSYELFEDASLQGTLMYNKDRGGVGLFTDFGVHDKDRMESLFSSLSLKSKLGPEMDMEISLKYARNDWSYKSYFTDTGELDTSYLFITDNDRYNASAKLEWKHGRHSVVAGADYEYDVVKSNVFDEDKLTLRKYALFLNDTIIIGKLTVIPGLRLDDTEETDLFVSPSLGLVYELRPDTLLRLYVARGFNDPQIADLKGNSSSWEANPGLDPETVWSYQAGIETGILKYLWLKISAFDHEIRDEIAVVPSTTSPGKSTHVNIGESRRQGVEAEIKTVPFYSFVFSAAASIIRAKDLETNEEIKGVPTSTVDLGLSYDDGKSFRGSLNGHSVMWNEESYYEGRYNAMIFDLHLIKSIIRHGDVNVEVFATGHNIFNGSQYWTTPFINARRWVEAGLRYRF